jgi:archaemetzincin
MPAADKVTKDPVMVNDQKYFPVPSQYLPELGDLAEMAKFWPKLSKPGPSDWLSVFPEKPQTVADLLASAPRRAKDKTLGIAIQPVLPLDDKTQGSIKDLGRFLEITFQCSVKLNPAIQAPKDIYFRGGKQINAPLLLDRLVSSRPADVWGLAGITSFDLGQEGMNFVFGMSSMSTGVSVTSNARKSAPDRALALRRLMCTVAHELGHALGISHCIAFSCMMNGSNHLMESDSRPTMLCPHCQVKLRALRGADALVIFQELAPFYIAQGMTQDRDLASQALTFLDKK